MSATAHADEASLALAARLRLEFDRAFSATPSAGAGARTAYLAIQIGGDPFALLLSDLVGVHVDRKVVPVPASAPTLLGVASFRGVLAPVHDLRLVLGYPARAPARWLVRVAGAQPTALAFDALEGQFTVAHDADARADEARARGPATRAAAHTRGVVQARDGLRPVVDVAAILATLARNLASARPPTER